MIAYPCCTWGTWLGAGSAHHGWGGAFMPGETYGQPNDLNYLPLDQRRSALDKQTLDTPPPSRVD